MSPAAAALLDRARAAGVELEARGNKLRWRAPNGLPDELLEALRAHKPEILAHLRRPPPLPEPWRDRLRQATDWQALYQIIEDAEVAFVAGELTGPVVERLARLCNVLARRLPEVDPYGPRIYAEDLLPPDAPRDTCNACGRASWWVDSYGVRHCATCHPPPGPEAEA